jgi:two-component system aerobic respiration control sensor histidine kinase ArcB
MTRDRLDGDEARRRLYDLMRREGPFEERSERALEVGTSYLGVANGHVAAIEPSAGHWEVAASTDDADGDFPTGLALNLETTYCRKTIDRDEPLALHDAPDQGWADDPAYETHGLDCYHAAPIRVDDDLYGTACFVDEQPREPFSEAEVSFTDLVARMVGHALERRRHETALAEHERELRQRDEWLRSIVEASTDVIFRIDTDGTFTFVSEAVEELLGYEPAELQGEPFTAVLPDGEALDRGQGAFARSLAGETTGVTDLPLVGSDGADVYVDIRVAPVMEPGYGTATVDDPGRGEDDREVVAVQGVVRDVTERRHQEQVIGVLNRVLRHNLRNDMNVARGLAETLREDLDDEAARMADHIVATADGLLELSETARKLESVFSDGPSPRPVDLVVLVERAVDHARHGHPDATIELSAVDTAIVRASPAIETAVHELVDNAARYAGTEASVHVEVRTVDDEEVLVTVTDDGPGLPEQDRAVLETGDETPLHHGSGLGLWLVHWLVSGLGGTVEATVDDGTTVTLRLAEPEAAQKELAEMA